MFEAQQLLGDFLAFGINGGLPLFSRHFPARLIEPGPFSWPLFLFLAPLRAPDVSRLAH